MLKLKKPNTIVLHKHFRAPSFVRSSNFSSICSESLFKIFTIPNNITTLWLVPHKYANKNRIKLSVNDNTVYIDKENPALSWLWLGPATRWIKNGYPYLSVEYEE